LYRIVFVAGAYPRRKVSGRAKVAAEHGQTKRSKEEDERQEEDVRDVGTIASVAFTFEDPLQCSAGVRQDTAGSDKHLVRRRVAVVVQLGPVPMKPDFQVAAEIFIHTVSVAINRPRPVHLCTVQTTNTGSTDSGCTANT